MKINEDKITRLTNANGANIQVATGNDGKLYLVDADLQLTRELLPDGVYESEGLGPIKVSGGKFIKSQYSLKKGIPPRATRIPMQSTSQLMQQMAAERKEELAEWRKSGRI